EDVPCHGNGEARVDDPLILLHRPDPTLRWRFWARKRRSSPTSVESRALPVRQVLGVASRTGALAPRWGWGLVFLELPEGDSIQTHLTTRSLPAPTNHWPRFVP